MKTKIMNLFVDANIFLDFYHFSNDDLDELKKLVDLINKGEITLVVTSQIIDEVKRNRDNKVADAYKKFKDSKIELNLPQICKSYPEFRQIKIALTNLKKLKTELAEKLIKDINERTLKADETIQQLFQISQILETKEYLELAKTRYDLGNPPGKDGSYGDALNWITLLSKMKTGVDLFLISDDKDFKSPLNEYSLNSYLLKEWSLKKKSDVFFYTKLSDFFNEHHTDIQLKVEEEKNKLIEELLSSTNYAHTHSVISILSRYVSFTDEQIRELVASAVSNSQVFAILGDLDLKNFYGKLIENREHLISFTDLEQLKQRMNRDEELVIPNSDDIPF